MLERIEIPSSVTELAIDPRLDDQIRATIDRVQAFQDRWDRPHSELFVAADYYYVLQSLKWTLDHQLLLGRKFIEWGAGFAAVTAIAAELGLDAIGIEAEPELVAAGRQTLRQWNVEAEIVCGNFLPPGADALSGDPTLPSLGHDVPDGYQQIGVDLDDFAIVYTYPWPGEDDFHEAVFDRYAAPGALLLVFYGPYDAGLWRKKSERRIQG